MSIEDDINLESNIKSMLFSNKLQNEVYPEWLEYCLDYSKLKKLLKEGVILQNSWTDKDEQTFVSALDENLEKVYTFQSNMYDELNEKLDDLQLETETTSNKFSVEKFQDKLENILTLTNHLNHFQRLNYTGFVKLVEKHDRLHQEFSVKPLLNVRLKSLPFHSEDYSPLLYKVSALFQFLRENYDINQSLSKLSSFEDSLQQEFQSFKFWVHPDNLMEVKTTILRHLPVLVYNKNTSNDIYEDDEDDEDEADNEFNQLTNCIYFDNSTFDLYNEKLIKSPSSASLRIKWVGRLVNKPKISIEKKNFDPTHEDFNMVEKIDIKEKYLDSFIQGKYDPSKIVKKMSLRGDKPESIKRFTDDVKNMTTFVKEHNLQPCVRSVFKRTAFQIPGDDKVRIILDSNLMFIREDAFDQERPIRDPKKWHRTDIDSKVGNPFSLLRKGEFSKFPYSVMEIKVKLNRDRKLPWIDELVQSHLVKEIPNFSKYIQGIASLFIEDEKLDNIPLWFNELESGMNVDVEQAFIETKKKVLKEQNEMENLSKFKSMLSNNNSTYQPRALSFSGSAFGQKNDSVSPKISPIPEEITSNVPAPAISSSLGFDNQSSDDDDEDYEEITPLSRLLRLPSTFSKLIDVESEESDVELPMGVTKPESYIKNAGPLKIEPKVWLANERTFNRWLHVTTLLSTLTFIIYSSASKSNSFELSEVLAYIYFGLTIFSGIWGYSVFTRRREIIMERSDKHLDNIIGPLIVAVGLMLGLTINFIFGWRNIASSQKEHISALSLADSFYVLNPIHKFIHEFIFKLVGA